MGLKGAKYQAADFWKFMMEFLAEAQLNRVGRTVFWLFGVVAGCCIFAFCLIFGKDPQ